MFIEFDKEYLRELFEQGRTGDNTVLSKGGICAYFGKLRYGLIPQ